MSTTDSSDPRRFEIALSFPGEHRDVVSEVAGHLAAAFGEERVLYDKYHDAEFARLDLNTYLPALYRKDSELIVVFLCPEYATKLWCKLEWRHISQLIATVDAKRIMFLSFGDPGDVSDLGILSGDGYIDILPLTSAMVAEKVLKRRSINQGNTATGTHPVSVPRSAFKIDISRIIKYAPAQLIGREAETAILSDAWDKAARSEAKRPHVVSFVALGGEGKTSLVAKWAAELAHQEWPGCDAAFAWSFYSQGSREQTAVASDLFLNEALSFFGDPVMAGSAQGAHDKGRRLAQLVGERKALLILDGLEPLQYAPTSPTPGELKDQGLAALLKGLAATSHGLCVITTRYEIPDLRACVGKTVEERKLARLSMAAGVALLQSFEVKGSLRKNIPSSDGRALLNELEKLVEDVKGHALTLNLLGSYLRDAHAGDIRKRDLIQLSDADAEEQGGHAFRVMDAYVDSLANGGKTAEDNEKGQRALALLRLLGLFERPAMADSLAALWTGDPITGLTEPLIGLREAQRNMALTRLEDAKLLTVNRAAGSGVLVALDAHPLLREYFGIHLRVAQPEAWRAAHRRLYEHLCATTKEGDQPTLEDLQPLYQAVAHGCQAGMQQEACEKVYRDRVQRGQEGYSWRKLGAFASDLGAVACFFETPWSRVSRALTEAHQAWLLNEAALRLRALGRLTEALEPMRAGLPIEIKREDWENAAIRTSNLSELELTLGEVAEAVGDAEQSATYADRSGNADLRMISRTAHADALHQAGRRAEAEALFREAEQMQAESQPDYPLYSARGFRYCDLLLTEAEREAGKAGGGTKKEELLAVCCTVSKRAAQTLKIGERNHRLLDIALDHLTLGRAALYTAILESSRRRESAQTSSPLPTPEENQRSFRSAATELDSAVSGLRRAGHQDQLPRGLLTRAWLRRLTGRLTGHDSAQSDLEEAWEIAERGPMPLFLADIHLYRARLFFREASYPWESAAADLNAARRLIEKHGYLRRAEELKDAEDFENSSPGPQERARAAPPRRNRGRRMTTGPGAGRLGERLSGLSAAEIQLEVLIVDRLGIVGRIWRPRRRRRAPTDEREPENRDRCGSSAMAHAPIVARRPSSTGYKQPRAAPNSAQQVVDASGLLGSTATC